jgi:plasmid stabilization system protein ParE
MTFEITDAAREDVAAAIRFYNSKPGRHGAAVRAEFNRAAQAIAANPRMYSPVEDEYPGVEAREFFIDRFNLRVIYIIENDHVQVIAVVHATRREGSWHRRLPTDPPTEAS